MIQVAFQKILEYSTKYCRDSIPDSSGRFWMFYTLQIVATCVACFDCGYFWMLKQQEIAMLYNQCTAYTCSN